jgi:hypothetical protein
VLPHNIPRRAAVWRQIGRQKTRDGDHHWSPRGLRLGSPIVGAVVAVPRLLRRQGA